MQKLYTAFAISALCMSLMGCGAEECGDELASASPCGDPKTGSSGTPPTIKRLELPTCFQMGKTMMGKMAFSDPDGDVTSWRLKIDPLANAVYPLQIPAGLKEYDGALAVVLMGQAPAGKYQYEISLVDGQGNESGPFCGTVELK